MLARGTDNTFPALRNSAAAVRGRRGNKQAKPAVKDLDPSVRQTWLEFATYSCVMLGKLLNLSEPHMLQLSIRVLDPSS